MAEDTKLPNWLRVDRTGMEYVTISRTQVFLMQKALNNNIYSFKLNTKIDDLDLDFNLLISFEDIVIEEEDQGHGEQIGNQTDANNSVTDPINDFVPFELS